MEYMHCIYNINAYAYTTKVIAAKAKEGSGYALCRLTDLQVYGVRSD